MSTEDQAFERFKEQVLKDGPKLGPNDKFRFECHKKLECFNRCCHDVNIFLTPYDVLRMKNHLGIPSDEFLDRYCVLPFSENLKYPIVMMKLSDEEEPGCQFLTPEGCSIYENRPWSCRMYPLGRAAPPQEGLGGGQPFYFLVQEDFCEGCKQEHEWTVTEWLDNQGVGEYDQMGRLFQELAQHPRLLADDALTPQAMDMMFMVCYDLDKFRRFVLTTKFLDMFEIAEETVESIRTSDEALMELGFDWLRFALWQEPRMKIRQEVVDATKALMEGQGKEE